MVCDSRALYGPANHPRIKLPHFSPRLLPFCSPPKTQPFLRVLFLQLTSPYQVCIENFARGEVSKLNSPPSEVNPSRVQLRQMATLRGNRQAGLSSARLARLHRELRHLLTVETRSIALDSRWTLQRKSRNCRKSIWIKVFQPI